MTDPIAEALDLFVPAFEAVDSDWQGVLRCAGYQAALSPAHRQPSPARSGMNARRHWWSLITGSNRAKILGIAAAASTAALIAFYAAPSSSPPHGPTGGGQTGGGSSALNTDPVPVSQARSDGAKWFGVAIALPDTTVLTPADASNAAETWYPAAYPGAPTRLAAVDVLFEGPPRVVIEYAPAGLDTDSPQPTNAAGQTVRLSDGTPAFITLSPDSNLISFTFRKVWVSIAAGPLVADQIWSANNDRTPTTVSSAELQAMAQSIVDQEAS